MVGNPRTWVFFRNKLSRATPTLLQTPDSEQSSVVQSWNFKQKIQFLKFKKEEAIALGAQALDLRLPFGEIEVLKENLDVIKRQIGLEDVEILSAVDADSLARAEPLASLLNQNPPSPGKPTAIFLTR